MSASSRTKSAQRAIEKGAQAFRDGKLITANPYKKSDWGNGGFWEMGWKDVQAQAQQAGQQPAEDKGQ